MLLVHRHIGLVPIKEHNTGGSYFYNKGLPMSNSAKLATAFDKMQSAMQASSDPRFSHTNMSIVSSGFKVLEMLNRMTEISGEEYEHLRIEYRKAFSEFVSTVKHAFDADADIRLTGER